MGFSEGDSSRAAEAISFSDLLPLILCRCCKCLRFTAMGVSLVKKGVLSAALLLLLLQLQSVSAVSHGEVLVVGSGECSDCAQRNIEKAHAVSGLHVSIACRAAGGKLKARAFSELDKDGKFAVHLPGDVLDKNGDLKQDCYAQLHSASRDVCSTKNGLAAAKLVPKSKAAGKTVLTTAGKLEFSPEICTSAFLWPYFKLPPIPQLNFPPFKKFFFKFPFPHKSHPFFKKPLPPPSPVFKTPTSPPSPVFKQPTSPPTPVFKKQPSPVFKKPTCPPTPVFKKPSPTPTPVFKKPSPTPTPVFKNPSPTPTPVFKNPSPTPTPVYKHPFFKHPFFKHPFFKHPFFKHPFFKFPPTNSYPPSPPYFKFPYLPPFPQTSGFPPIKAP